MRLLRLHLQAFGPFTGRILDLARGGARLALIYGPNEAGKSATLRAIGDLRFGVPQLSADNFRHAHPDMRIAGVFADPSGAEIGLVRRKGRGQTLLRRPIGHLDQEGGDDEPISPELEAALTGGLSRDEYDTMFSLDHQRLRKGGEALLEGEGETGAALFEASSGVRSVRAILERLDASARQFYLPGTRAKSGRINEALRAHDDALEAYRKALVRPAQWADLARRHEAALLALETLEGQARQHQQQRLLIGELRAVAPMLRVLDQAQLVRVALADAPVLPADAPLRRAAAQAGLASARQDAERAQADSQAAQARLARLSEDSAVLAQASAIERLNAQAGDLDEHLAGLSDATTLVEQWRRQGQALAARIDATLPVTELVALTPSPSTRAVIEERLRALEAAEQAMASHQAALAQLADEEARSAPAQTPQAGAAPDDAAPVAPAATAPPRASADPSGAPATADPLAGVRAALRSARTEVTRHESLLNQLAAWPTDIAAAEQTLAQSLTMLGVRAADELRSVKPLLDADIDTMLSQRDRIASQSQSLTQRIGEIDGALAQETLRHQELLGEGVVPTADDLARARSHRDRLWTMLRPQPGGAVPTGPDIATLSDAFEAAVRNADRLADELARDTRRAARLQGVVRDIGKLTDDRAVLVSQLEQLEHEAQALQARWTTRLHESQLPPCAPEALREWQARLAGARAAAQAVTVLRESHDRATGLAQSLARSLASAIAATGQAGLPAGASVLALAGRADEIEQELASLENRQASATGELRQRSRERARMQARQAELVPALRRARTALDETLAPLRLPAGTSAAVARARLGEFERLASIQDNLAGAELRQSTARHSLQRLAERIAAVLAAVAETSDPAVRDAVAGRPGPALRLSIDALAARLAQARRIHGERLLAMQAIEQAQASLSEQQRVGASHEASLAMMCAAAGVASPEHLPQAEDDSARRRAAQEGFDHAASLLAQAAHRSVDELRVLLRDRDPLALDADESQLAREWETLELQLKAARAEEASTRQALAAIDSADAAAAARESMERAGAAVRASMDPWIRSRLAHALLAEATRRFRDRAQGPMLAAASRGFERMTGGEFVRLISDDSDDRPVLIAVRQDGSRVGTAGLSEGTRDQLFLALRLAALTIRGQAATVLPLVLDDVLMTSDDRRATLMLQALADHAQGGQVIVFTHHRHLLELACGVLDDSVLATITL
ncbi:MAG: AAA family ATPase [Burkholderiaceae bacterium]|nr:AAA family ATPase [Burkholderiaceae bacterium]